MPQPRRRCWPGKQSAAAGVCHPEVMIFGVTGLLPVPEIQYLAYLHNAEDQIRGEAATLQFFSRGQYRNPAVIRVTGDSYQHANPAFRIADPQGSAIRKFSGTLCGPAVAGPDGRSLAGQPVTGRSPRSGTGAGAAGTAGDVCAVVVVGAAQLAVEISIVFCALPVPS